VFAHRTVWLTAISLALGLAAALALDLTAAGSPARDLVFAGMFAAGLRRHLGADGVRADLHRRDDRRVAVRRSGNGRDRTARWRCRSR
jgi:hypothetical protein